MSEKTDIKVYRKALNKAYTNLYQNPTPQNVLDVYSICEYLLRDYPSEKYDYYKQAFKATALCKNVLADRCNMKDKAIEKLFWQIMFLEGTNKNIDSALIYLERYRDPAKRFYKPRRDTLIKFGIIDALQGMVDDRYDIVSISMPPRTGKTTLESFFFTLIGGWNPDNSILSVSYAESIIKMFYKSYMDIITDKNTYAWQEMFGKKAKLQDQNAKDTYINLGRPKNYKTFTTRSIDGSITGATEATYLLACDDLIKNQEEALNKQRLAKLNEKYSVDLLQRKKQKAKELHIATRWSVCDVIGTIIARNEGNERAKFISVPALNENGESNFEYEYGVGFNTKYYLDLKENMDEISFNCLYQQQPVEREGLLFESEKLRRYYDLPPEAPDAIWSACDTKDKGTDFVSMPIAYQYGDDFYIEDVAFTDTTDYDIVDNELATKILDHKVNRVRFESNNAGGRVASDVQKILDEKKARVSLETKFTRTNKETKILTNSDFVMKHFLFKDETKQSQEYKNFINQVITYTAKGKNLHDDAPDSLAMLSEFIADACLCKAEIFKSIF